MEKLGWWVPVLTGYQRDFPKPKPKFFFPHLCPCPPPAAATRLQPRSPRPPAASHAAPACSLARRAAACNLAPRARLQPRALCLSLRAATALAPRAVTTPPAPTCLEAVRPCATCPLLSVHILGFHSTPRSLYRCFMASAQVSYLQKADVMLDGKNYKAWSSTLRVLLRGLNLWGHVDGTRPPPISSTVASSTSSSSTVTGASSSPSADLLKWTEDDARTIAIICQSCELPIRLAVCDFSTSKAIWDHLRALYLPYSQALRYSLLQTLTSTYQRESFVSDFFAMLSDLWRQCDEMAPSPSPTCDRCLAIAQDRDYLRIYEFLMRLRPEFEAVRAQLLHRVTPSLLVILWLMYLLRRLVFGPSMWFHHLLLLTLFLLLPSRTQCRLLLL
ncbi:Retrotransposon Copia-like N-terminal protein [Dioscorea alata]|uniref:Retrotransposon Copia-like N-terminal protein n=1 Tax=Dioscorea alata TaxID=55571 RepID=A0ACB7UT12_DIOAL|nr:Retrotransposon Copia-like N-terminal protein [Dioscorea alata]